MQKILNRKSVVVIGMVTVLICLFALTYLAESASVPSEILSPVVGDLEVVSSLEQCTDTKWCFNQYKSGGHVPGGGICQADDTYAWDANLNIPEHDTDNGKPVYAVEQGVVTQTYGDCINAGGSYGQLLIEHKYQDNTWWSGYLHLRDIQVEPSQSVDKDTLLGYISNTSPDQIPNHLHFVVYKGQNSRGELVSFDANIVERSFSPKFQSGDYVQTTENLHMRTEPKINDNVITTIPSGSTGQIVDDEDNGIFASGYNWWHVQFGDDNGWCVEDWLEKVEPSTTQSVFTVVGTVKTADDTLASDGLEVVVSNETKDLTVSTSLGEQESGKYGVSFVSTENETVAAEGDTIKVTVKSEGEILGSSTYKLTSDEIAKAQAIVDVELLSINPVFTVVGTVKEADGSLAEDGLEVVVSNETKDITVTTSLGEQESGRYAVAFVSTENKEVAAYGDTIKVTVKSKGDVLGTSTYNLTSEDIAEALALVDVTLGLPKKEEVQSAIIAVGTDDRFNIMDKKANTAYQVLCNLGFDDKSIHYLNNRPQTADGIEVDDNISSDNLKKAITEWAPERIDPSFPLILYLVSHGDKEAKGVLDFTKNDVVSGDDLDKWLETFSTKIREKYSKEPQILIVIDACFSGSFITDNLMSISSPNRVILTSTTDTSLTSWPNRFSLEFFQALQKEKNVRQAFISGSKNYILGLASLKIPWLLDEPWLNDTGTQKGYDGEFIEQNSPESEGEPGFLAANMKIGEPSVQPSESLPHIYAGLCSPGELQVYDSEGRVTGLVNGNIKEEIPYSIYIENKEKIVMIFSSFDTYRYEVIGTEEGTYGLTVNSVKDGETTTFTANDIPTSQNAVHQYSVDWDALKEDEEEAVTVKTDSDGDGTFEETVNTGKTYTQKEEHPSWDVNSDGAVNIFDLVLVGKNFGETGDEVAGDVNDDKQVNIFDLVLVGKHFGEKAAPSIHNISLLQQIHDILKTLPNPNQNLKVALKELRQLLVPKETVLMQNYPNPFNPETWIPFKLASSANVEIRIYNLAGQLVREIELGNRSAGIYLSKDRAAYWDGRNNAGERISSGTYFYTLEAGDYSATRRMLILK